MDEHHHDDDHNEHHDDRHHSYAEYFEHLWHEHSGHFGFMNERTFMKVADLIQNRTHERDKVKCDAKLAETADAFFAELALQEKRCRERVERARETMVHKHARIAAVIKADLEKHQKNTG